MPGYTVTVLGQVLSFEAEVSEERLLQAIDLVERHYAQLEPHGRTVGKERLLIYLALSLADECLQKSEQIGAASQRVRKLMQTIDTAMQKTLGSA